jgi:hypothetical protein
MTNRILALLVIAMSAAASTMLIAIGQEPSALKSADGIAYSEFAGYESWPLVSPSVPANGVKAILGNPTMVQAFKDGIVSKGLRVPDGAMMAKVTWGVRNSSEVPEATMVPGTLRRIQFMRKDSKRFPNTDGWGYAQFDCDETTKTFKAAAGPAATGASCHQCHTRVLSRDFVFTDYAVR